MFYQVADSRGEIWWSGPALAAAMRVMQDHSKATGLRTEIREVWSENDVTVLVDCHETFAGPAPFND